MAATDFSAGYASYSRTSCRVKIVTGIVVQYSLYSHLAEPDLRTSSVGQPPAPGTNYDYARFTPGCLASFFSWSLYAKYLITVLIHTNPGYCNRFVRGCGFMDVLLSST